MDLKCFQACYGRPDTGWAVVNTSPDIPKGIVDDFTAVERVNAAAVSGNIVAMGANETPSCMWELYCKNDTVGLVRIQYHLSDIEGRPISFAHGYLFPNCYDLLKKPEFFLTIARENFADQRLTAEEKEELRKVPGALNRELMKRSVPDLMPSDFLHYSSISVENALKRCGMDETAYKKWMIAVYSQILTTNTQKNLYVKTDGSEEYAINLLYLTYAAIPYSLRPLLSASTYLRQNQRNTKLIFCAELPAGVPQYNPSTGETNIISEVTAKRTDDRNPIISAAIEYLIHGEAEKCFVFIEACLDAMANDRITSMQSINLAHSIYRGEFQLEDRLPSIIYSWLTLPVPNSDSWEEFVCFLLEQFEKKKLKPSDDIKELLTKRLKDAVTEDFSEVVKALLT